MPAGLDVSDEAGTQQVFHSSPSGTGCGIHPQFPSHDLVTRDVKDRVKVRKYTALTRGVPGHTTRIHTRSIPSVGLP